MTLAETLVALALLGVGILMTGSVVVWAAKVEERAARRAAAIELATGIAERVRAAPYGLIESGRLDLSGELPPEGLEEPVVDVEVRESEELGLKRVVIRVSWSGEGSGRFVLETAVGRGELYR